MDPASLLRRSLAAPCRTAAVLGALAVGVAAALAPSARADEAGWLRDPALAPDGKRLVFTYRGDLWTVPVEGGRAEPLTSHEGVETSPCFSPDGSLVAFASDRHGNFDVFVVPAAGGVERRLTFHSGDERPTAFAADGRAVLFVGRRGEDATCTTAPWWPGLWSVSLDGKRPTLVLPTPALSARPSPDGTRLVYEDLKSGENSFRKRHRSSAARDLWSYEPATGRHVALTRATRAEDRDPWVGPDGRLWFLSERDGTFNVYVAALAPDAAATRVTDHREHPVRSLSLARDGTLAYSHDGALYVKPPTGPSRRLAVVCPPHARRNDEARLVMKDDATELAPSPDGEEVAFVVRGDVFVASVKHGTTKRVTDTPGQERMVAWAPDGKSLYYAAERAGSWDVYVAAPVRAGERRLSRATLLAEKAVVEGPAEQFSPAPSPDGKHLAYVRHREEVVVRSLEDGADRVLLPAARNLSYVDGDVQITWSSDSRYVAATCLDAGRWIGSVVVIPLDGGAPVDVARSGYEERAPRFSKDGRLLTFVSDRFGPRSHGSWGSQDDVVGVLLSREAFDRFRLSVEEHEDLVEQEEEQAGDDADGEASGAEPTGDGKRGPRKDAREDAEKPHDARPVGFEPDLLEERTVRLTPTSAPLAGYAVSSDGETVLTAAQHGRSWGLFAHRPRLDRTDRLAVLGEEPPRGIALARDQDLVFVLTSEGRIESYDVEDAVGAEPTGAEVEAVAVDFEAEVRWRGGAAREAMYDHVVRQVAAKFYDPSMHGVDWTALAAHHRRFLPHVADATGFAELLSELLGELDASHTGAYRFRKDAPTSAATASLGLLFDLRRRGDGLVVTEVLPGGPADRAGSRLAPGVRLTHLDGVALADDVPVEPLLDHRAGRRVVVRAEPAGGGEAFEEVVKPIDLDAERELLYRRWRRARAARVERGSGGRVGYVHVRDMDDAGFRSAYQDVLGRSGAKEALVVDTRHNGGGWLHDDLLTFLGGREYLWVAPRGKARGDVGAEPLFRWARPSAVLVHEDNYSDAHVFPFAVQALKVAPVVGARVPGTGTAVWWETLLDPELVFGIPQVGLQGADGRWLENQELVPDLEVVMDPESAARGDDPPLDAAVRLLLETLRDRK